jgi:lysozyme family protein
MFNVNKAIGEIIVIEGGYVDDPDDAGGATNYGITQKVYARFLGVDADWIHLKHLIKQMPKSTAALIYKQNYYYDLKIDLLPSKLQHQVMDISINSGENRAYKILQKAINDLGVIKLVIDGRFGKKSWAALDLLTKHLKDINNKMVDFRRDFYLRTIEKKASQLKYKNGWLNRAEKFRV